MTRHITVWKTEINRNSIEILALSDFFTEVSGAPSLAVLPPLAWHPRLLPTLVHLMSRQTAPLVELIFTLANVPSQNVTTSQEAVHRYDFRSHALHLKPCHPKPCRQTQANLQPVQILWNPMRSNLRSIDFNSSWTTGKTQAMQERKKERKKERLIKAQGRLKHIDRQDEQTIKRRELLLLVVLSGWQIDTNRLKQHNFKHKTRLLPFTSFHFYSHCTCSLCTQVKSRMSEAVETTSRTKKKPRK